MKPKVLAIFLMVICALFTSTAQVLYKYGLNRVSFSFFEILFSPYIWLGLIFYGFGSLLFVMALKKGKLSVLYPIIATSYIWVFLFSIFLLNETVNLLKIGGLGFILMGIILISGGSK